MTDEVIYLDNNATTCVAPEVFAAMKPFLTTYYGNASSIHTFGGQVGDAVLTARGQVAELIGAEADEIVFTSCGTEADNAAILSALENDILRRHIVTSKVEHPAVLGMCKRLHERGYKIDYCPVNNKGQLCMSALCELVTDQTALVSIMWANNETGNIYPVFEAAEIAHQSGALFHTDAVQAVGKVDINLRKSNIDFLSLSGHKLHAPKGIGALYIKRRTKFYPSMIGGHQEGGRRSGTENVAGIVALGEAARLAGEHIEEENTRVSAMRDRLESGILKSCPDSCVNGNPRSRLPNTTNISFSYIEGESILLHLDQHGIAGSSGSACTSGSLEPSHVLRAMGVPEIKLHGSLRLSLSRYTTDQEIDETLKTLPPIVEELRKISPYGR